MLISGFPILNNICGVSGRTGGIYGTGIPNMVSVCVWFTSSQKIGKVTFSLGELRFFFQTL